MTMLALAGDTMLGRGVGEYLAEHRPRALFSAALLDTVHATDGLLLNLECCISERGTPRPGRVFHFRAPPSAVDALTLLGVRCVTLANNHALDFGEVALLDTLAHLERAGIAVVGAGASREEAQRPTTFKARGPGGDAEITVVSFTDDPVEYAAGEDRPGVAYADIEQRLPQWLVDSVRAAGGAPSAAPPARTVIASPHWGPNMTRRPKRYIVRAAAELTALGATLTAGHSAHVFHGVAGRTLFDLGDFVDDYAVDPRLRNDLGLLWLVDFDHSRLREISAVPLRLTYCHTAVATGDDAQWVTRRLREACREWDTDVAEDRGRLVVTPAAGWDLRPLPGSGERTSVRKRPSSEGTRL